MAKSVKRKPAAKKPAKAAPAKPVKAVKAAAKRSRGSLLAGPTSFGYLVFQNKRNSTVKITVSATNIGGTQSWEYPPTSGDYKPCPANSYTFMSMPSTWVDVGSLTVYVRSNSPTRPLGQLTVTTPSPGTPPVQQAALFATCTLDDFVDSSTNDCVVNLVTGLTAESQEGVVEAPGP